MQPPNDASGTRFGLDRGTGSGPFFAPRVQFSIGLAPRHELRLLLASLEVKESGNRGTGITRLALLPVIF